MAEVAGVAALVRVGIPGVAVVVAVVVAVWVVVGVLVVVGSRYGSHAASVRE